MGGRVLRRHQSKPHATIVSFTDQDDDSIIFGELAGSYHSLAEDYEFPPSTRRGESDEPGEPGEPQELPWPEEIPGLNVHYLTRDIEKFAERRRAAQAGDKKPKFMLTASEAGSLLNITPSVLEKYVFDPLKGLYDQRHSRQQELDIRDAFADKDDAYISGQRLLLARRPILGWGILRWEPIMRPSA